MALSSFPGGKGQRMRENPTEREEIKADVIIPTYRPGKEFETLLERLGAQTLLPEKIVIMNTEEEYWNPAWEEKFPSLEVHHIRKSDFDHGGTRREGEGYCTGDYLVYMTQDALPADIFLLENLIRPIREKGAAASYARQIPRADCSIIERYNRDFNYPGQSRMKKLEDLPRLGVKTYFCSNVCAAYDRNVYHQLGGFVSSAIFNEDMFYAWQVIQHGYAVAYAADARVVHSHNYTCRQQFRRNFDLGVSQAQHPEIFENIPSEKEGIRLVKDTAAFLVQRGKPWMLAVLFAQSAARYAGYLAGKNYRRLPPSLIRTFTMNPGYWEREEKKDE